MKKAFATKTNTNSAMEVDFKSSFFLYKKCKWLTCGSFVYYTTKLAQVGCGQQSYLEPFSGFF